MGGLAPGQLKSRRGWHSSPRRLHYRFSFFDRVSRTHCGKNSINFAGMAHSHRHRLAAAWPSLVRQIGPVLRRRRQAPGGTEYLIVLAVCYERIPVKPFREPPGAKTSAKELRTDANRSNEGHRC